MPPRSQQRGATQGEVACGDAAARSASPPPREALDARALRSALPLAPAGWGAWGGAGAETSLWAAADEDGGDDDGGARDAGAAAALHDSADEEESHSADAVLRAHCDALRCGPAPARHAALAALAALRVEAVTDSACWGAVCPALRAALAAPPPSRDLALALLRRLLLGASSAAAGCQLAQLAAVLAAHVAASAADGNDAADAAAALLEADAALRACWQGMGADALAELAAARVALLRIPAAGAVMRAAERAPRAWPATWCAVAPACAALAAALRADADALAALVAAAFSKEGAAAAPDARAAAVATLGALLHAAAVRALFPVRAADAAAPPAWLAALCDAFGGDAQRGLSLSAALGGLLRAAVCADATQQEAAAAAAAALASLAASPRGGDIAAALGAAHMRALAAPLSSGEGGGAAARAAALCAALAEAGDAGIAALRRPWGNDECALAALAAAVAAACDAGTGAAALQLHARTLAAAARDDAAVRCVLLPSGVLASLAAAHAAEGARVPCFAASLAALAWTPRAVAALCDTPGAAHAAAAALVAIAASESPELPCSAALRDARCAASALSSQPLGAAALCAAGWRAEAEAAEAHDAPLPPRVLAAACTAVEALLAAHDPAALVALRRGGTAPAALLSRWLRRDFRDAARWPDAAGYAALSGDAAAALVTYPAALLLGPLRGAAARAVAQEGDAAGGGGVLLARLRSEARGAGFAAADAAAHMRELRAHAALARFRRDAGVE